MSYAESARQRFENQLHDLETLIKDAKISFDQSDQIRTAILLRVISSQSSNLLLDISKVDRLGIVFNTASKDSMLRDALQNRFAY